MAKKIIAPTIIATLLIILEFVYIAVYMILIPFWWAKILIALVPLALIGVTIFVLIERINEIRSGEEDDLSKY